jgi:hypothetical protein
MKPRCGTARAAWSRRAARSPWSAGPASPDRGRGLPLSVAAPRPRATARTLSARAPHRHRMLRVVPRPGQPRLVLPRGARGIPAPGRPGPWGPRSLAAAREPLRDRRGLPVSPASRPLPGHDGLLGGADLRTGCPAPPDPGVRPAEHRAADGPGPGRNRGRGDDRGVRLPTRGRDRWRSGRCGSPGAHEHPVETFGFRFEAGGAVPPTRDTGESADLGPGPGRRRTAQRGVVPGGPDLPEGCTDRAAGCGARHASGRPAPAADPPGAPGTTATAAATRRLPPSTARSPWPRRAWSWT